MTLLLALIEYLVDKQLCQGDGIDCFRDFTPEEPDEVIVFHEYEGDKINQFITSVHRSIQVTVRSRNAERARHISVQLCEALRSTTEDLRINFSGTCWGQVYIRQAPIKLKQDDTGRVTYGFNLGITTNNLE